MPYQVWSGPTAYTDMNRGTYDTLREARAAALDEVLNQGYERSDIFDEHGDLVECHFSSTAKQTQEG